MGINPDNLWQRIRLGEDSGLELREVRFCGERVDAPTHDCLADELAAFANGSGGCVVLGVADDREPKPLDAAQLDAVVAFVSEICNDSIDPAPDFLVHRVAAPAPASGGVLLVEIPAGNAVHRSPGGYLRRQGDAKRVMTSADIRRLLQTRGQSDASATDTQLAVATGVNTLRSALWGQYASSRSGDPPDVSLVKLKFAKVDPQGTLRATVGGVLLGTEDPAAWLPNAYIQAVCYDGEAMDGNRQLDAQDITGPLDEQIRQAVRFVVRNSRVAARKGPARTEVPQFSERAVFEAIVNAVVHRDYAVSGSHIRLFVFNNRLELYSPGGLCNSMTTYDLRTSQFTRNELIASRLGQCQVGEVAGAGERQYFIERRGEGIATIEDETFALAGTKPIFELLGERELRLTLPAASPPLPDGISARICLRNAETDVPLKDAQVLILYPNKTYREARTDVFGHADFVLHARLPITVLCAAPGFAANVASYDLGGKSVEDELRLAMQPTPNGGSQIIANRTGNLASIHGRLNPILDNLDRMYLYADNVAINDGVQQPTHFKLHEPVRLTDSLGNTATVWFREMLGASCVFDYRTNDAAEPDPEATAASSETAR